MPASHVIYVYTAAAVVVVVEDAIFLSERDMSNRPTETGAAFYRRDLLNEDQVSLASIPKIVCMCFLARDAQQQHYISSAIDTFIILLRITANI